VLESQECFSLSQDLVNCAGISVISVDHPLEECLIAAAGIKPFLKLLYASRIVLIPADPCANHRRPDGKSPLSVKWPDAGEHFGVWEGRSWKPVNNSVCVIQDLSAASSSTLG
jgi:hypothetical protein